eukprot:scaffold125622_cov18-Prasinocladus_malaysianus.AAC.1
MDALARGQKSVPDRTFLVKTTTSCIYVCQPSKARMSFHFISGVNSEKLVLICNDDAQRCESKPAIVLSCIFVVITHQVGIIRGSLRLIYLICKRMADTGRQ